MSADTAVANDLSTLTKRTIQMASLVATVMVVGIHYKTDVPDSPSFQDATWNQVLQEFWFGGIARVAVPMFSLIAGLLYFRSDDGTFTCYRKKFFQRCRTVLFPYFIVASIAMTSWLAIHRLRSDSVDMGAFEFLTMWLVRPPAEQLWFLRDLMVLVAIAPLIRWATQSRTHQAVSITALMTAWTTNFQPFPIIAGWHLIHIETLLFFTIGCCCASQVQWVNRVPEWRNSVTISVAGLWFSLVAIRVWMRPDFDIWYTDVYDFPNLIVHQLSILVGCFALMAIASRIDSHRLQCWSGASFFVFLVHEFPLRAAIELAVERIGDPALSCWLVFPGVVIGCYAFALLTSKRFPVAFALITGGRTPAGAGKLIVETTRGVSTNNTAEQVAS
ncbi:MAG: acyltransferase [Planctomycetales bacterium]|nr:acyltransferase [Planctomycetales bacterium]